MNRLVEESKLDLIIILIDNFIIYYDVEILICVGEYLYILDLFFECKIFNLISVVMEYIWLELRSLLLKKYFILDMDNGVSILLDDILDDFLLCDFFFS